MAESIEAREAAYGDKMIQVRIRFWTNDIAPKGKVRPKHAWPGGVVRMASNKPHGITPKSPRPFNSLADVNSAIEKVLLEHGIKIHQAGNLKKLIAQ